MHRITDEGLSEIIEKKSRFLGFALPVRSADEAVEKINAIRKKHYDARHVCYAYIVNGNIKSSDDGEPQGTAGRPITDVIIHNDIDNILIAVVRYFGGILLGTGGLIRAYTSAASEALSNATLVELIQGYPLTVNIDYNDYGRVDYYLNSEQIKRLSTEYNTGVTLHLMVESDKKQSVDKKLAELTAGKADCEWENETEFEK